MHLEVAFTWTQLGNSNLAVQDVHPKEDQIEIPASDWDKEHSRYLNRHIHYGHTMDNMIHPL